MRGREKGALEPVAEGMGGYSCEPARGRRGAPSGEGTKLMWPALAPAGRHESDARSRTSPACLRRLRRSTPAHHVASLQLINIETIDQNMRRFSPTVVASNASRLSK